MQCYARHGQGGGGFGRETADVVMVAVGEGVLSSFTHVANGSGANNLAYFFTRDYLTGE